MTKISTDRADRRSRRVVPLVLGLVGALSASAILLPDVIGTKQAVAQKGAEMFNIARSGGFADLVEKVKPSVVSVRVLSKTRTHPRREFHDRWFEPEFGDTPRRHRFREFFERFGRRGSDSREHRHSPRRMAQGSGFIISSDGYVVTNQHVVANYARVSVTLHDGKKFDADVIGTDSKTDLALLKIKSERVFQPVKFADKAARVGDWVIAVGNPFGLGGTVTTGIVSARGREIGSSSFNDFIQIDAAINRGNSGGPAFNLAGEVIGINTAIFSPTGGNVGIGFAIPAKIAKTVIADLKSSGKVTRGWLGVSIQRVTGDIAASLGLDKPQGAMVVQVMKDSPAGKAGLKPGDAILKLNGEIIRSPRDLARKVSRIRPDAKAELEILRDGKRITQAVTIEVAPKNKRIAAVEPKRDKVSTLALLGLDLRADDETDAVVIVDIDPDGVAAQKGLRRGDRIVEVDGARVKTPGDVKQQLAKLEGKGRKAVLMLIRSNGNERFVALRLKNI